MDHIMYQVFKIYWIYFKKHGRKADNPSIRIYIIKIKNRIGLKQRKDFILNFQRLKRWNCFKNKISKDKKKWECTSSKNYWNIISTFNQKMEYF